MGIQDQDRRTNNMEPNINDRMTKIEADMDAIKNRVSGMEQRMKMRRKVESVQDNDDSKEQHTQASN